MTVIVPLKPGEILVPKPGMWTSFTQVKLKAQVEFEGKVYWSLVMTGKTGNEHLDTMSEDNLRSGWVRKPSFFRFGKTYKFPNRPDTWKILDLYELDNGVFGSTKRAVARVTYVDSGYDDIQTLTENDFTRMVEA